MRTWWAWLASALGMIVEMIYQSAQKKPEAKLDVSPPKSHEAELEERVKRRLRERFSK